jgi:hypothetical protein
MKVDPEELRIDGPGDLSHTSQTVWRGRRSRWRSSRKTLATPGRAENWNTVAKLLAIAEKLEGVVG